jgi:hypothetical protein
MKPDERRAEVLRVKDDAIVRKMTAAKAVA